MKNFCFILFAVTFHIGLTQELLLVIDEQFANKTFDSFDDLLYAQIPGDLHFIFDQGEVGENGFGYSDTVANFDGTGFKKWHYQYTQDSLIFFPRRENVYTTNEGLTIEANSHVTSGGIQTISAGTLIYPWTFKQGYFEMNAKLPEGTGIMSTWFFYGTRSLLGFGCEPSDNGLDINWQEVDVWETNGHWPTRLRNNIHFSGYLPDPTFQCQNSDGELECNEKCSNPFDGVGGSTELNFTEDFHTFGMYWDQKFVILFVDGYVYRYWTKPEPINKGNGYPDPLLFLDAMLMYTGTGYGTQLDTIITGFPRVGDEPNSPLKDEYSEGDNLFGPDPRLPIPSSKLEVNYFRYWVFIPCEDQDSLSILLSNSYYNQKTVSNYNSVNYGHFETGQSIICSDSYIGPEVNPLNPAEEYPYAYSDQLNLIASRSIHLHSGFHAKAATWNYPIDSQFHGKIQTCSSIPQEQPMPLIQNFNNEYNPNSFWGDFQWNLENMIDASWENSGPLKSVSSDEECDNSETGFFYSTESDFPSEFSYSIYANPFTHSFIVEVMTNYDVKLNYEIRNSIGEFVSFGHLAHGKNEIFTDDLNSGLYFINLFYCGEVRTHKLVKA